ncbi:MAG: hypothetical protein KBS77_04290 [Bacteroidales bacterium]|nr:hypothetical protein [Candidatus Colicola faecequi]
MKRITTILYIMLLSLGAYAQQIDLLDVRPEDNTIKAAKQYSDSVENKIETITRWGKGDERFSFATMQLDLSLGHQKDHLMGDGEFRNYGLGLSYTPFQFSTWKAHRPCFFGGGITLGLYGMIQPEDGYVYSTYGEDKEIVHPETGETVMGSVSVMYDQRYYKLIAWRANFTIGLPLAFTAKIGSTGEHQVSLGVEPEIGLGAWGPWCAEYPDVVFSWTWTLRAIMQYRYKNLFVSFRPAISVESFSSYWGDYRLPHAKVGIGWNF